MVTLSATNLSVKPGDKTVLYDVSLPEMHGGQVVALVGPNGSGKSSLIRLIAGLRPADSSNITLFLDKRVHLNHLLEKIEIGCVNLKGHYAN